MASEGRQTETILTEASQSNHTRTTALSNSMKVSHARGATQDGWVMVWLDWLVFCEYGFSVSALWCPLATPTVLLGFLLPWTWGISSRLLQQSYFKSWKMILWKCCTQYASKFGKLSSGHRTGKGQCSFQSQRKAMPKNAQSTAQLHSSHTLVK